MYYSITDYKPEFNNQWNDFVKSSLNGTFLFHRDFMDYHANRFKDYSLLVFNDGDLLAVLPAHIEGDVLYSHQGLTYGGLVYKSGLKLNTIVDISRLILYFLSTKGVTKLVVNEVPQIYYKAPDFSFQYILQIIKAKQYRTDVLSIVKPIESSYSKDRKAGYKRGLKNGLKVEETNNLLPFWNQILIPNLQQKHDVKPVHSVDEILLLKSKFSKQIRQFNVYYNGTIVAGTTIFETEKVAHSQYISGNKNKNKLGSLDFLHVYLLENVFKDKPYFDFGTSNENNGSQINNGLLYWKQGFGCKIFAQKFYEIETRNHLLLDAVFN